MKVIVKKKFENSFGRTFLPSLEVIEMHSDPEVFRAISDGRLQMFGETETRIIKESKKTTKHKENK